MPHVRVSTRELGLSSWGIHVRSGEMPEPGDGTKAPFLPPRRIVGHKGAGKFAQDIQTADTESSLRGSSR
ncbi:hypothetical protein GCM10010307_69190 [Streptomyces vastus]|uniref:Uncharacterized protein n=1 Tax=Streptomyces vastus TaxID=285451 RepID=A0ABP6E1B1_9ACTN